MNYPVFILIFISNKKSKTYSANEKMLAIEKNECEKINVWRDHTGRHQHGWKTA